MNILDKFFVALGFQVDTDGIDQFERKTEELRAGILRLGALFTGAAIGIGYMVEKTASAMGELKHFADLNHLTAEEVAGWNRVAALNLISQEASEASLQTLNQRLGEAAIHLGRGAMIFKRLGLEARDATGHVKTLDQIMDEVSDKMQKSGSRAANLAMARRLGIDAKFVPVLEQGRQKLRELREEAQKLNPFKEEDYKRAEELNLLFVRARLTLNMVVGIMAVKLMPVVERVLTAYLAWFKQMRADATGPVMRFFQLLSGILGNIWEWAERLIVSFTKVTGWLLRFKITTGLIATAVALLVSYKLGMWVTGVASAVGTLAKAMMELKVASVGPVLVIGLLLLALGLLIDDIVNFYEGNESVIGQMQDKFPAAIWLAHAAVIALSAALVAMKWKALVGLVDTIRLVIMYAGEWAAALWRVAIANIAATWEIALIVAAVLALIGIVYMLWKYWDQYAADIVRWWHDISDAVTGFIGKVKEAISYVKTLASQMSAKDWLKFGITSLSAPGGLGVGLAATEAFASHPSVFQGSVLGNAGQSSGNRLTRILQPHYTVPAIYVTSPDPDRAGQAVVRELDRLHRGSTRDAQSGVGI